MISCVKTFSNQTTSLLFKIVTGIINSHTLKYIKEKKSHKCKIRTVKNPPKKEYGLRLMKFYTRNWKKQSSIKNRTGIKNLHPSSFFLGNSIVVENQAKAM